MLEKATQTHGNERRLYLSLAEAYAETADHQKAVQTLKSAYSMWPGDAEIRIALALELLQAGDPTSACAILEEKGNEPLTEGGQRLLAQCYLALNRTREAEQAAQRAASGNAPEEASLLVLANIYLLQGRDQEIITLLERHRLRFSESPKYLFTQALSYYNRGNYSLAFDLLTKVISRDPALAQAHYLTGNCLSSLGKLEDAIPHYQTAVSLAPGNFLYRYYLGLVLSRVGKKDMAEEELKRSIELNGSHAPARYELAKIYFDTGRNDLARVELEKATKINPELESSYYLLSRVYASLGRNDEASALLKQFRQIQQNRREEERAMKQPESSNEGP
jgi:tetratricopeptide (TPR) repeat protein